MSKRLQTMPGSDRISPHPCPSPGGRGEISRTASHRGNSVAEVFDLLDRLVPSYQADFAVDRQGRREQRVQGEDPADFRDVLDGDRKALPSQGRFHVGFQLPAIRTAGP